jgi:hypothetical protein
MGSLEEDPQLCAHSLNHVHERELWEKSLALTWAPRTVVLPF